MREKSCCSLTWRDEKRWKKLLVEDQVKNLIHVLLLFAWVVVFVPFLLHPRRDAFVSYPPRGIKCKKASSCVSRSAFCTRRWYLIISESLGDGYKWKGERKKRRRFFCVLWYEVALSKVWNWRARLIFGSIKLSFVQKSIKRRKTITK